METFFALLALCGGIHRSPVNSPHKGQWRETLMFSFICAWTNGWVTNRDAGDLGHNRAHYDVTAICFLVPIEACTMINTKYKITFKYPVNAHYDSLCNLKNGLVPTHISHHTYNKLAECTTDIPARKYTYLWGHWRRKTIYKACVSNYIIQYWVDVITYPCPR